MKSKRIFYILFLSFLINGNWIFANYAFKKKVKDVCKSYRVPMESSQLSLDVDEIGINIEGGRNNFEMFMLVGFASAGEAIKHQQAMELDNAYVPSSVRVSVSVPISRGEFNIFVASCDSEMAISLADGSMDSAEFMQKIMKNMEIL